MIDLPLYFYQRVNYCYNVAALECFVNGYLCI